MLKMLVHTNCEHQSASLLQTPPTVRKLGSRNESRPYGPRRSPKKSIPHGGTGQQRALRADGLIICQRVSGDELSKINALHNASAGFRRRG